VELETGHSELVVGMPGSGKTFGDIMRHLRMMKRRNDTMLVLVDPVGGFRGIADALNAKTITVGGDTKLNPLEIRETPQHVLDSGDVISPLSAKKDEVYAVLENFLDARDIELGTETGVLSYVIDEAYRQAGSLKTTSRRTRRQIHRRCRTSIGFSVISPRTRTSTISRSPSLLASVLPSMQMNLRLRSSHSVRVGSTRIFAPPEIDIPRGR